MQLFSPPSARVPWKNGLGTTLELATDSASESAPWSWRLSIADVPSRAAFSNFPGITRHINCLDGKGLVLHRTVNRKHERASVPREGAGLVFEGEEAIEGEPLGEGVRDVNLMLDRSRWTGSLSIERDELSAGFMSSGTILVHLAHSATPLTLTLHSEEQSVQLEVGATLVTTGLVSISPAGKRGKDSCTLIVANLWPVISRRA